MRIVGALLVIARQSLLVIARQNLLVIARPQTEAIYVPGFA